MAVSWSHVALPAPVRAVAARGRWAIAALADGRLARSSDAGSSWLVGPSEVSGAPSAALFPLPDAVLVGTATGVVRASERDEWEPEAPVPEGIAVTALAGRGAATIAGTRRAGVYRSADGGIEWEASGSGLPLDGERLRILSATAGREGLVVAHALGVSRSLDGGRSWASAGVGLPLQMPDASLAADGQTLYAGVAGRLFRASACDSVLSWDEVYDGAAAGPPVTLLGASRGVLFSSASVPPTLLASGDGGATWAPIGAPLPSVPVGVCKAGAGLLVVDAAGALWQRPAPRLVTTVHLAGGLPLVVEASPGSTDVVVTFELAAPAAVRLVVQDALEHDVACLTEAALDLGTHHARLPVGALAPGMYRLRLLAGTQSRAIPFVLFG